MDVDLRTLEPGQAAFVHDQLTQFERGFVEDALEVMLAPIAEAWPQVRVTIFADGFNGRKFVTVRDGQIATVHNREATARMLEHWNLGRPDRTRLPGRIITDERISQAEALATAPAKAAVPELLELLRFATLPSEGERDLRRAVYESLARHGVEAREALLHCLGTEPDDDIAAQMIRTLAEDETRLAELPARIDAASRQRPYNARLALRLVATLVAGDDQRAHAAWLEAHYPQLLRQLP
jgi:hypothetical protein